MSGKNINTMKLYTKTVSSSSFILVSKYKNFLKFEIYFVYKYNFK